jgi:AcrR family transcriptional regulator
MSTEEHILKVTSMLLERDGAEALTTRAVCQAAGVTAPTLYHHFGDKEGLLRVVVARGVAEFMVMKRANRQTKDPIADLRRGWNGWIAFAVERPNLFKLMIDSTRTDASSTQEAYTIMHGIVVRLHAAGRIETDIETAALTIWAASNGVLTLFMQGVSPENIKATSTLLFDALIAKL